MVVAGRVAALIDKHEPAASAEGLVRLLLGRGNAAVIGGLDGFPGPAVTTPSLGRGNG